MDRDDISPDSQEPGMDVFLLTKPQKADRTKLCLQLMARSENAALYLAGDGVYNLLDESLEAIAKGRIFACREDLLARGVQPKVTASILNDFYEILVVDMMENKTRIFAF